MESTHIVRLKSTGEVLYCADSKEEAEAWLALEVVENTLIDLSDVEICPL